MPTCNLAENEPATIQFRYFQRDGLIFGLLSLLLAAVFSQQIYDGDSYDFAAKALNGELNIDPNHLLMGPTAFVAAKFSILLGWGTVFSAFKVVSALSVAVSMYGFVILLRICGIHSRQYIAIASAGVLSSYYFAYSMLCEEFYVIQLPFLIFGACLGVRSFMTPHFPTAIRTGAGAGLLFAIAALYNLHNVVLCIAIGLFLWRYSETHSRWKLFLAYSASGAVVGVAGLMWGYVGIDSDASFLDWVSSYEGSSGSQFDQMYGMRWTVSGITIAIARAGISMIESVAYLGNLPSLVKSLLFGGEIDFDPNKSQLFVGVLAFLLSCYFWMILLLRFVSSIASDAIVRFGFVWLVAYTLFGIYWSQKVAQFWFPIVPIFWLLLVRESACTEHSLSGRILRSIFARVRVALVLPAVVLLVANYSAAFYPNAAADMREIRREYLAAVDGASLVISPGWGAAWINHIHRQEGINALYLMEMAFDKPGRVSLVELHNVVDAHLSSGGRVFVNRLYDKDANPRPWSDLQNMSWSRPEIIALLDGYCRSQEQKLAIISVRELKRCES